MTEPREYGCVKWPDSGYRDTGEGGMWVYAFVLADAASGFIRCCGPAATVSLPLPDVVLRDDGDVYPAEWPDWRAPDDLSAKDAATEDGRRKYRIRVERWIRDRYHHGRDVLAAVCVGTSACSWHHEDLGYWTCTPGELTDGGADLLRGLEKLYGIAPVLVTFLDT